mmetsp:Transcript_38693/g.152760  ORF Transcript_38693/g.152760 Transcript_38693/m.152760 type:complete len:96 (+) Transcript_38693:120-407(+)
MLRSIGCWALVVRRPQYGAFSRRFLSASWDSSVKSEDDRATNIAQEKRRKGMFLNSKDMSLEQLIAVEGYLASSETAVNMSTDGGLIRKGLQKVC